MRKSKKIKKVPAGSKVAVLYVSKLGYAKIRYQGKYGYIFRSVDPVKKGREYHFSLLYIKGFYLKEKVGLCIMGERKEGIR